MKRIVPVILIFFASCMGMSVDQDKAKTVCENLILAIKGEKFDRFSEYYTNDFFQNTTKENWIVDLGKMKEILGPIVSYQLTEINIQHSIGEQSTIVLDYDIQHSKFKSHFTFTVVEEEGKHKVFGHRIKSDAL